MKNKWKFYRILPFVGMLVVLGVLVYLQDINFEVLQKISNAIFITFINVGLIMTFLYMVKVID